MRHLVPIAMLAGLAACAPPQENQAANEIAGNEAVVEEAPVVANDPGPVAVPSPPAKPKAAPTEPPETYSARGQEPGWALAIAKGRIDYQGNYGEKRIEVARPDPVATAGGRRYVTDRLTVEIVYKRCNDAMSGFGFEHRVKVTADGESYDGCGGPRRTDWDM